MGFVGKKEEMRLARRKTRDGEREEVTQELLEAAFQLRGWMMGRKKGRATNDRVWKTDR